MRILKSGRGYFHGTHKGCEIVIERDKEHPDQAFYIIVTAANGGHLYDGWAPANIRTIAEAKREALRGACLDRDEPALAA